MAQSVKLKDGSLIDTEGIYDATQGKTQKEVNSALMSAKLGLMYRDASSKLVYTFDTTRNDFWILTAYAILSVRGANRDLFVLATLGVRTFTLTHSGATNTLTIAGSEPLYGGILVIA